MTEKLNELLRTRRATQATLNALDTLIAEEAKPLWQAHLAHIMANCTLAQANSILTEVNRFLEDRDLPALTHVSLAAQLKALGYVRVRRTAGNYYRLAS